MTNTTPQHHIYCARCGTANPTSQKFCGNCGTPLVPPAMNLSQQPPPPPPQAAPAPSTPPTLSRAINTIFERVSKQSRWVQVIIWFALWWLFIPMLIWRSSWTPRTKVIAILGFFLVMIAMGSTNARELDRQQTAMLVPTVAPSDPEESRDAVPTSGREPLPTTEPTPAAPSATALPPTLPPTKYDLSTPEGQTQFLLATGDLPPTWSAESLFAEAPVDYDGPNAQIVLSVSLQESPSEFASGSTHFWHFTNRSDADTAFAQRTKLIERTSQGENPIERPNLGERAFLARGNANALFILNRIVVQRCNTVTEITFGIEADLPQLLVYAEQLDQRVRATFCP